MAETTTPETAPAAPMLKVLRGNPTEAQVAALAVLFATMARNAAAADSSDADRNLWGNVADRLSRPVIYNPTAFHNVSFY